MSNKKYKKCFCVEEVDETNNPNSDDIENVGIDESLLRIDDDDDVDDDELMRRLAKLKEPTSSHASNAENNNTLIELPVNTKIPPPSNGEKNYLEGGYKRTKSKGEHLIRSYSYKSKKGGKRRTVKHNKKRRTVKHNKKRRTVKHNKKRKTNKKRTMKKKKFNKK